jgi:hypothetical protein
MSRHVRQYCKIANSEDGMNMLIEHTLERQLAEHRQATDQLRAEVSAQAAHMAELTTLLKQQIVSTSSPTPTTATTLGAVTIQATDSGHVQAIVAPVTNISQTINIMPWDGERRIAVDVKQMAAALASSARLRDYACWPEHELTDPEKAPPYVAELFMDLVKRGHAAPEARNIYLNPRRADQVLVHMKSGQWEVLSLAEATQLMFDGVAKSIHGVIMRNEERVQLPLEAQNALSLAEAMYWDEPDEYARRVRAPMSAHLTNTAPDVAAPR